MTEQIPPRPAANPGIRVRPATTADLPVLLEFEQGVVATERPMDPTIKEGPVRYYDLDAMIASPDIQLLVAELDGHPIASGYARIEAADRLYLKYTRHAYLGFMYVTPAHRGKGVNHLILEALRQWAHTRDITELRLEVYSDNEPAIRAYEKAGFTRLLITMRSPTTSQ